MTYDNLNIFLLFCAVANLAAGDFEKKVALLLQEEIENPKCFAEGMRDLTCFWEEGEERAGTVDQYTFTYTYKNEGNSSCPVKAFIAAGGKKLYVCRLNQTQMFIQMDIQVRRHEVVIHDRSLFIEQVFLLDTPANVTVRSTDQQGQLRVSWLPPSVKYMHDSMLYQVSYAPAGSHKGQVKEVQASSELVLRDLQPGTQYRVHVRVKPDEMIYDGYWSDWSDPVFMETLPAVLDPLIVSLSLIISLILTLLSLTVVLSHRRFLIKKVWPVIPNPESKFQGLFTVYGGNFQEWLGQTNGGLWLAPAFLYAEESPSALEVLSEVCRSPPLPPPALPPKVSQATAKNRLQEEEEGEDGEMEEDKTLRQLDSALVEGWRESPHDQWVMDQLLHQHPGPHSQSLPLESHDAYVMLNTHSPRSRESPLDNILEETMPLQVFFASNRTMSSESRSDLGSLQQSSGSGRLSSQSSFEYPNHTWPPKGPGYTYMAVADSGVSMDYSPMSSSRIDGIGKVAIYANEYKNDIPANRKPALTRQHALHSGWGQAVNGLQTG